VGRGLALGLGWIRRQYVDRGPTGTERRTIRLCSFMMRPMVLGYGSGRVLWEGECVLVQVSMYGT
jgi:hypothetical protein